MWGLICVLILANHGTATFRRDSKFLATVSDILADELFAPPVVIGGVDEIDAFIEYRVQDRFGLLIGDRAAVPDTRAANLHGSKTQTGDI
jgi:hypothetical protein